MTAWHDVERAVPEFAQRVRELFDVRRHKTIATVRADGSPRISGIEAVFEDGALVFGSMPNARKGAGASFALPARARLDGGLTRTKGSAYRGNVVRCIDYR